MKQKDHLINELEELRQWIAESEASETERVSGGEDHRKQKWIKK